MIRVYTLFWLVALTETMLILHKKRRVQFSEGKPVHFLVETMLILHKKRRVQLSEGKPVHFLVSQGHKPKQGIHPDHDKYVV